MEEEEEIKACQNIEPHDDYDVRSKAVQLSALQPVKFNKLQCNTNLNLPPSNWLTSSSPISYNLHQALYNAPGCFASFRLAHMFPDSLEDVEVVSDAENIKKLLKLSYSAKSVISMMVHRVGNTLLIDEFDIQKYLLRKYDEDWKWLRKFIIDKIIKSLGEKERKFYSIKDKSREALQSKNLLSKFLYHSLGQYPNDEIEECGSFKPLELSYGPLLPEPNIEKNIPDPKSAHHVHNRNVIWTFEDIRMLIGTDMPIFGGPNRPCISLRLRDMNKPINVLTGIDYWLDNLMCNVPEVVMCYHLDGLVQKYELIKTEDLPYLENSQFSTQVVRNVAQNILAFLKAKATKAGHTYWLFKGKNDEVVKLYDLTTLCQNRKSSDTEDTDGKSNDPQDEQDDDDNNKEDPSKDKSSDNPFTVPVAMLLYTVARNMKNTISSEEMTAKKAGSIRTLLYNCIKLLPKEKYPQIVTSSYYILSDLHIPAGIDPRNPRFYNGEEADSDYDDNGSEFGDYNENDFGDEEQVAVQSICETLNRFNSVENSSLKSKPLPLLCGTSDRCITALMYIACGFTTLKFFNSNEEKFIKESEKRAKEEKKRRIIHEEQNPNMAKPFQPIPLPYEKLDTIKMADPTIAIPMKWYNKKKTKAGEEKIGLQGIQILDSKSFGSWNVHLKLLLLEKACLVYTTFMEHNFNIENFGTSLKCIHIAYKCHEVVVKYMGKISSQRGCLLCRAGDCLFKIFASENQDLQLKQFFDKNEDDAVILDEVEAEIDVLDYLIEPTNNIEQLLLASCRTYEESLIYSSEADKNQVLRRLGNVRNELGLKYMLWSQDEYEKFLQKTNEDNDDDPLFKKLAYKSYDNFIRGIECFEQIEDHVNLAFLRCNLARFCKLRGHIHMPNEKPNDVSRMKFFYLEAMKCYEQAKLDLESRKTNPDLWDLVNWELSTATFTIAKHMQDHLSIEPKIPSEEAEKEVLNFLQKALKMCDYENLNNPKQILYTYRVGIIHGRIASYHHNQVRNATNKRSLKTSIQLSQFHHEKAAKILESLKESADCIRILLEYTELQEFLAENSKSHQNKIKHFQTALMLCLKSQSQIEDLSNSKNKLNDEAIRLMKLFSSRLQNILKNIIKLMSVVKDQQTKLNIYKNMYLKSLEISSETEGNLFVGKLAETLREIRDMTQDVYFNKF